MNLHAAEQRGISIDIYQRFGLYMSPKCLQ